MPRKRTKHPKTLDDAIAILPGLARFRRWDAASIRKVLSREKGQCTWCGDPVPRGRRAWCSDECVTEFSLRCDPGKLRWFVEQRDRGICHYCGCDCQRVARVYHAAKEAFGWGEWSVTGHERKVCHRYRMEFERIVGSGLWEAHHTRAVVEGGGLCGPEDVVTACLVCHKQETKKLASRRAG